jgi:DNA-binding transcriptional LysR family regulator
MIPSPGRMLLSLAPRRFGFMEFFQLQAFVAVAELRSFGQAAEELSRSQPAISISIKKLEDEIGVALLDRYRRDVRLTDAGQIVFEYAQKILNLRSEISSAIDELRQLHHGKVSIGANESTNLYLLPKMILSYRGRYPEIKVEVFRSSSVHLPKEVKERNLDFGIVAFDPADPELVSFSILEDELILVVPPKHRFAKKRKVTIQDLVQEIFVAHNVQTPSRDYVIGFFRRAGVPLNIGIELSSMETIKEFVQMNQGIAILPKLALEKELRERKLIRVQLEGFEHKRTLRVIYLHDKVHSQAAERFLELLTAKASSSYS